MESTTIVALASGHGVAGVAIIRLSGSHAKDIALKITKRQDLSVRYAHFCHFYYQHGAQLDSGVVLFFKGPHSFTGEDVVELQCHGGALIIKALIDTALTHGATMAKPGAFTERAFLNGKLDLLQAEAVADLIHAQSSAQASAANASLQGAFSKRVHRLQQQLEAVRIEVEAAIDFSEQAIPTEALSVLKSKIQKLHESLNTLLIDTARGVREQTGMHIVISGPPNVGKSSLLNYLTQTETAIVTDIPGTTRDLLTAKFSHNGHVFTITDTAGLRETNDPVERKGIDRAREAMGKADCIWALHDLATGPDSEICDFHKIAVSQNSTVIKVGNKLDLVTNETDSDDDFKVSAKNGIGVSALLDHMCDIFFTGDQDGAVFSARSRHIIELERCKEHLHQAAQTADAFDLVAEEMRLAQQALSSILGAYGSENLLDAIFRNFCLGK